MSDIACQACGELFEFEGYAFAEHLRDNPSCRATIVDCDACSLKFEQVIFDRHLARPNRTCAVNELSARWLTIEGRKLPAYELGGDGVWREIHRTGMRPRAFLRIDLSGRERGQQVNSDAAIQRWVANDFAEERVFDDAATGELTITLDGSAVEEHTRSAA